ncbi:MAG TPA: ferredoxin [Myxococcaceae bacterium]|nr:ferredoxin [Myxococcaceae bacterium]
MGTETFRVDARACIRCGACATAAPAHFSLSAGPARLVRSPAGGRERAACRSAAALCPTQAIAEPEPVADAFLALEGPGGEAHLYPEIFSVAECARWRVASVPWHRFHPAQATAELCAVVRAMAYSEQATFSATQRFMAAFSDDPDFSQWISVWFYEETRHPMVLLRWLVLAGEEPGEDFVRSGRVSAPFMKSRIGTLVTNVISELVAAQAYLDLARASPEPLLAALAQRIGADEARHAASFFTYARRALERAVDAERERLDVLKVLHFWLHESQSVSHPVNETMEKLHGLRPEDGPLPPFALPRRRMARVIGLLAGLPLDSPEDLADVLIEHTRRVHTASVR